MAVKLADAIVDEALVSRLPLPLAQLYRRAHNAKTPQDRHHAAYCLWEAGLKLLGSVSIVEYAELADDDPALAECLENLARPSLGHWWEWVRRLLPVLAGRGDQGFSAARELLLGRARDDMPRAAGLDVVLTEVLDDREVAGTRSTVRLTELFDRLVQYRNREIGHGALGQRSGGFYDRVGRALLAGVPEVLGRLDALAGRRLLYIADVRRLGSGRWLAERYELRGEAPRRLESLELSRGESVERLVPDRVYLDVVDRHPGNASVDDARKNGDEKPKTVALHPLLVFDADAGEALFWKSRRGRQGSEYLSYSSGRELARQDLATEHVLLGQVLHIPVEEPSVVKRAERSPVEEEAAAETPATAPRRLGEFELLSELGRGGMGVVYRAWQPSLGRQVAVKALYHSGDPKAETRFFREIRALGHVEHPHLVKIFVSGSEADRWFFAMELIEGVPLAAVCDKLHVRSSHPETVDSHTWQEAVSNACAEARQAEKPLSRTTTLEVPLPHAPATGPANEGDAAQPAVRVGQNYVRQVVELVAQAAQAAHALHERGILHRDIKPGNIMVTAGGGQAILMDLGLAQIADEVDGRLTRTRQFVGTLRYASPEQVLAVGGLDRRSDVYNLGATLWELITLRPMFGATEQTPTPELMRRIQVEEPERPRKHHPGLSRDLEAIVLKCLEKDRGRRYASAHELVRDLERFLAGEPVRARPVSGLQRGWRWCRRKPALAGMVAALLGVVLGSLAALSVLYLKADRQRRLAVLREKEEAAISKFYEDYVLAAARPRGWFGGGGKDLTLKEALDQATTKIDQAFAGEPVLAADVRHTIGMTYWYLGQFAAASPLLEKAYAIRLRELGPDHPDTLTSLLDLALERWKEGNVKESVPMAREVLNRRRRLGPEHVETLWAQLNLGLFLEETRQLDEAESVLRHAVGSCQRTLGPDHHHTLYGQNDLAIVLGRRGKLEEALELDRETLEGRSRSLGPDHPDTLRSMDNLAYSLQAVGRLEEAETLCRQSLEGRRHVLGDEHMETLWSESHLGELMSGKGNYVEAERILRHCLKARRHSLGPDHMETQRSQNELALTLWKKGNLDEALELHRRTLETRRRVLGPKHVETLRSQDNVASVLLAQGELNEAEKLRRQALETREQLFGLENSETVDGQYFLAIVLREQGRLDEAEKLLDRALDTQRRVRPEDILDMMFTQDALAGVFREQGKLDESEKLHQQTLETRRRLLGGENPITLRTQCNLALVFEDRGKLNEADKLFRRTLECQRRLLGPENPSTLNTQKNLASFLAAHHGDSCEAEKLLREVLAHERKSLGPEALDCAVTLVELGSLLIDRGHADLAEPLLRECLAIRDKRLPADDWRRYSARSLLGGSLCNQGKFDEAEPLLVAGYEGLIRAKFGPAKRVSEAIYRLVALYERWCKDERAAEWKEKLALRDLPVAPFAEP